MKGSRRGKGGFCSSVTLSITRYTGTPGLRSARLAFNLNSSERVFRCEEGGQFIQSGSTGITSPEEIGGGTREGEWSRSGEELEKADAGLELTSSQG